MLKIQRSKPAVFQPSSSKLRAVVGGCLLGLSVLGSAPAHARIFTVEIEFGEVNTEGAAYWEGSLSCTLTLETAGDATSFEQVISMSGTFDGNTVTELPDAGAYQGNDNLIQNQPTQYTTEGGISFALENGGWVNLYNLTGTSVQAIYHSSDFGQEFYASAGQQEGLDFGGRVSVSVNGVSSVPEPTSLALILGGLGWVGVAYRRQRPTPAVA